MSINLEGLLVEIPYKWRVQSFSKYNNSCSCVAYIDARDAMDLLDKIVGPMNWQSDYREIRGNLYAGVAIFDQEKKEWVWKWDCGIESQTEKEKGEASDSFKRACVKWGIGRFLYSIDIQYLLSDKPKTDKNVFPVAVDENGKKIKDITTYINNKLTTKKAQDSYKKAESQNIQKDQKKPEIAKNQLKQEIISSEKVTNIDKKVTTKDKIIATLDELIKNKDTFEARVISLVSSYASTKDIDLTAYDWFIDHVNMLRVDHKIGIDQEAFNKKMGG